MLTMCDFRLVLRLFCDCFATVLRLIWVYYEQVRSDDRRWWHAGHTFCAGEFKRDTEFIQLDIDDDSRHGADAARAQSVLGSLLLGLR